ncbi:hypothetical protein C8R43DRAFT_1212127 [Mycena crocata]|nr:hypothetical protein C8R43DRAFT_1212127 [Mycena crocata]
MYSAYSLLFAHMILSLGSSFVRRLNARIICFALVIIYCCYYLGSLSGPSLPPQSSTDFGPRPKPVLGKPHYVTVTVEAPAATVTVTTEVVVPRADTFEERVVLNGPPTAAFKDNLRPDVKYITAWLGAGFTNDVMSQMNLIYLSLMTERVPILPPFNPTHIKKGAAAGTTIPTIDFGEVYDIPRLQKALGKPVLEWFQVKDRNSDVIDPLGCWDVWTSVQTEYKFPHGPHSTLKLDMSYTPAPTWIKLSPGMKENPNIRFSSLMALAYPMMHSRHLRPASVSRRLKVQTQPTQQLQCFDYLYWIGDHEAHEIQHDYSPVWRFVGQHVYWTPKIENLADMYLRKAFGTTAGQPTPPYIAIHVRHGDFKSSCSSKKPLSECFAPLSAYARRVEEVRSELAKKGIKAEHVVMTSDEKDPGWWEEVRALGWYSPDHTDTVELYGRWYPVLVDAAIQSASAGFVGTARSTVSIIASRRVVSWRGGAIRMVQWGRLGADDH